MAVIRSLSRKERFKFCLSWFQQNLPEPETELDFESPYQLLVAVMLSAQCTDKRVNLVTPPFFQAFPSVQKLAEAEEHEVLPYIKSISYPNSKARHLVKMAQMVMGDFGGSIPMEVSQLVRLPGVGRKTANVITSVLEAQPNMAVDTHVFRVSARIGLTYKATTPLAAEKQLVAYIPETLVHKAHHWLILHGRYTCTARSPKCNLCGLSSVCKHYSRQSRLAAKQSKT